MTNGNSNSSRIGKPRIEASYKPGSEDLKRYEHAKRILGRDTTKEMINALVDFFIWAHEEDLTTNNINPQEK